MCRCRRTLVLPVLNRMVLGKCTGEAGQCQECQIRSTSNENRLIILGYEPLEVGWPIQRAMFGLAAGGSSAVEADTSSPASISRSRQDGTHKSRAT